MLPDQIIVEATTDDVNYKVAGTFNPQAADKNTIEDVFMYTIPIKNVKKFTSFRLTAKTTGKLPQWHEYPGQPSWLFTDEIMLKW